MRGTRRPAAQLAPEPVIAATPAARTFRIGEVADRTGVTPRTIRYYEELGLLGCDASRSKGSHRVYGEEHVLRLQELIRLKDLLGLSLEEIVALAEAEEARAALRGRWAENPSDPERLRIVEAAIPLVQQQLELVRAREQKLAEFASELSAKLKQLRRSRADLAT